jgi:cell division protein FtsB
LFVLALVALVIGGLGWLYGSRLVAMGRLSAEVRYLKQSEENLLREIAALRERLDEADDPAVVEEEARRVLGWGYPDEERLVLIWR